MSMTMPTHVSSSTEGRRPRELTGRAVLVCLVAFFAVVGAVNAVMIRAAVSTFGGVETANSYQAGLAFAREIAAVEAQDALHWQVGARIFADAGATAVEVAVADAAGRPLTGLQATALLTHPADRRADHALQLREEASGRFRGRTPTLIGQWVLVIELWRDGSRVFRSKNRVFVR
jgi:nitrogen fixation protein FixH